MWDIKFYYTLLTNRKLQLIDISFSWGTIDKITKILNRGNIKGTFSPLNSSRTLLDSAKDLINLKLQRGVYPILCFCGKVYIGETS